MIDKSVNTRLLEIIVVEEGIVVIVSTEASRDELVNIESVFSSGSKNHFGIILPDTTVNNRGVCPSRSLGCYSMEMIASHLLRLADARFCLH